MSSEPTSALADWARIRAGGTVADGLGVPTVLSGVTTAEGPIRLGIGPLGEARLLIPLRRGRKLPKFPETRALRIVEASYQQDGISVRFLDLVCKLPEVEPVFADVVETILERILGGEPPVDACLGTLRDFRTLLVAGPADQVSPEIVAGLVGELVLLNRLLERDPGAVRAWTGPIPERHDFRAGGHAIEVKVSGRVAQTRVRISSLEQLLEPEGGTLHLLHLTLERETGGPLTVGRLAALARERTSDPDLLSKRLSECDCEEPDAPEWNREAFRQEAEAIYEVTDGFPRLVTSSLVGGALPEGVGDPTYDVDLALAAKFRLGPEAAKDALKKMLSCMEHG